MCKQPSIRIVACALLFWLSALFRFVAAESLHHLYRSALGYARQQLRSSPPSPVSHDLQVEVAALDLPQPRDGSRVRLVAQARLNGRVILQRAAPRQGDRLVLQLPSSARGLLEISVAAINSATCMVAGASESRWLEHGGPNGPAARLAFSLPLRLFSKPLCS